jgi:hypothetical protein
MIDADVLDKKSSATNSREVIGTRLNSTRETVLTASEHDS